MSQRQVANVRSLRVCVSLLSLSEDSDAYALGDYVIVAATGIVFAQHD